MNVYYKDDSFLKLYRQKGHLYIPISTAFSNSDGSGVELLFILDTGAFMTVISRVRAERFGYDKLPRISSKIKGFTGEEPADFVRIPSLKILNTLITNVPVLIPHSKVLKHNIIGLNVLEYFNYYINTGNDRMYIDRNPTPRPYDPILACGSILVLETDE
jgi:clan AA aspartic protease (TIGR02281 family)